ncbi:hypothetical protein [Caldimonas tepidiphila]|uniref:hypothetical protein n=1 Tax=Caldimonas tepidiphila TaxID=2315841 RepID=UPI000E5AD7E7|nr:hypothetical protein [Caldimonas tepidiphila]
MTEHKQDADPAQPCGFGLFEAGELLVAFPTDAKAREVLQACEQDGYQTDRLVKRPIFLAPPPPDDARLAALETELQQARLELAALRRQRDEVLAELMGLRERL